MTHIMSPEDVTKRFGRLFCKGVYTMVDEPNGVAMIIEECIAKGPVEWDAVNRLRAGGAITKVRVEGTTLIMDTKIGEGEVRFGPASKNVGGQGLRSLFVEGDTVKTTWVGLAGASVGIGACLPQGPGTISTEYPDDIKIGGAHKGGGDDHHAQDGPDDLRGRRYRYKGKGGIMGADAEPCKELSDRALSGT